MKCAIKNCAVSDDRHLWRCFGSCNRMFHAACAGVSRTDPDNLRRYMLPLCLDCQERFIAEMDIKKCLLEQREINLFVQTHFAANEKSMAHQNSQTIKILQEACDNIESMLGEVKISLKNTDCHCNSNINEIKTAVLQNVDLDAIKVDILAACSIQSRATEQLISNSLTCVSTKIVEMETQLLDLKKGIDAVPDRLTELFPVTEVTEEIKALSTNISNIEEELTENRPASKESVQPKIDHSSSGWRFLGNKWRWMQDWSKYDAKQQIRRLQEKAAEKARRNRKRRKHHTKASSSSSNTNHNNNKNDYIHAIGSDKKLLASAKVQFAGPPSTTVHPIAGLSVPNFINFRKGETINPYRTDNQTRQKNNESSPVENNSATTPLESHSTPHWSPDPMRPPIVNLTQQSADGDRRFLKARLRDPKIMYLVRLYLAYMHDKDSTFCYEGMTNTSIKLNLASEGLPVLEEELQKIFFEVHEEFGVPKKAASDDLCSYRRHLHNQRIQFLQRARESEDKFHRPIFRK